MGARRIHSKALPVMTTKSGFLLTILLFAVPSVCLAKRIPPKPVAPVNGKASNTRPQGTERRHGYSRGIRATQKELWTLEVFQVTRTAQVEGRGRDPMGIHLRPEG